MDAREELRDQLWREEKKAEEARQDAEDEARAEKKFNRDAMRAKCGLFQVRDWDNYQEAGQEGKEAEQEARD